MSWLKIIPYLMSSPASTLPALSFACFFLYRVSAKRPPSPECHAGGKAAIKLAEATGSYSDARLAMATLCGAPAGTDRTKLSWMDLLLGALFCRDLMKTSSIDDNHDKMGAFHSPRNFLTHSQTTFLEGTRKYTHRKKRLAWMKAPFGAVNCSEIQQ